MRTRRDAITAVLIAVALAGCAQARPADTARAVERQVWSPYCPGRLLIDCTTEQARDLRTEIEERVSEGQSADQVLQWIRLNYGDEAMARPASFWVWSFPIALIVVGGVVLAVLIRRWTRMPRT